MRVSWKTGAGRSLIVSVLAFACSGICIHRARQYASLAPGERTTTAYDVQRHYHFMHGFRFNYSSCDYIFSVDGWVYSGNGDCPQPGADDSNQERPADSAGVLPGSIATVYYDPSNPSINGLTEFNARSEAEYRYAILWIGVGVLMILSVVFIAALTANENRGNGGIVADAEGTVIDPEDLDTGSEFGGPLDERKKAAEFYAAASAETAYAADSDSSPGLRELYLEVVNRIHPDRASNEADLVLRERLMKEANTAFKQGDAETLRRVLEEYQGEISAS